MSRLLMRLLGWMRPYWRRMAGSVLLGILTIGSSVALMATSAWLISKASLQPSIAELSVAVVGVRFFGIARGVLRYGERLVSHETTFQLLAELRVGFYRALEPLAPARLTAFNSGDLLARVVNDVDSLQNLYLRAITPPLVAFGTAGLLSTLIAAFDPLVAVVALVWFIGASLTTVGLAWWLGQHPARALAYERASMNAVLVDTVQGMADLIAYGAASREVERLSAQAERLAGYERSFARLDGLQAALAVAFSSGALLTVAAAAVPRVDGVYLATLALATAAAYEAIIPLGQAAATFGTSLEGARRLFEIADLPPAVTDAITAAPLPTRYDLDLEGVRFRYAPDLPPILAAVNLHISQGQRVAIIGESGAGKSTLVSLLARFWDYEAGSIRVGGIELRDLSIAGSRQLFAVMTQQTYLFNTTIAENIRIARPDASDTDVQAAARAAQIHDFIRSLPEAYETNVGENGIKLSGGERQRIGLARVVLKDAPILILDEATANVDAITERCIMDTLLAASLGKTVLVLTHHPQPLTSMDAVYRLTASGIYSVHVSSG